MELKFTLFYSQEFHHSFLPCSQLFHSQQCLRRAKCPNNSRSQNPPSCRHTVHTHLLLQQTQGSLACWDLLLPHLMANYLQLPSSITWRCISEINTLRNVSCSCNYTLLPGQMGIPGSWAPFLPREWSLPASISTPDPRHCLAWHGWDGTWLWEHWQRLPTTPCKVSLP